MAIHEPISGNLNEQQIMMMRLLKQPMAEDDFLQIRRLAVKLLAKQLDETIEDWETKHDITEDSYEQLAKNISAALLSNLLMRIVLDSNVLLIAIGKRSAYRQIWNAFLDGKYQLLVSEEIIHEYEEILQLYSAPNIVDIVMEIFLESPDVIYQRVYYNWNAITNDPDDDKFFDVAVAGNAGYIVTNDAHFNEVSRLGFPSVKVISANDFLKLIND